MAQRTRVLTAGLGLVAALVLAAPAQATLVYVKKPASAAPAVYVAEDDGSNPRRVGVGRSPAVSPDGQWIAYIVQRDALDQIALRRAEGGATRLVLRSKIVDAVRFSPDSAMVGAILGRRRLKIYSIASDTVSTAAFGYIRGWDYSPDSKGVVWGFSSEPAFDAPGDLYTGGLDGAAPQRRLTTTKDSLNPLWGARGIVFDRQRRRAGDAPAYNLWEVQPDGSGLRRITKLSAPRLVSGLVPVELSADGARLLAAFTGQDTLVGFTVATHDGATRAISRDFSQGMVGFDLTADGRTILAHTGGGDPGDAHDVVTIPYRRSTRVTTLARNAAYPDWSR